LDQVSTLKLLAEELIKNEEIEEGVSFVRKALELQTSIFNG
jgi:hypothetical protein